MRKIIFLLFFIPAVLSLGHDIYFYTQQPEKGFQLTDIGAFWAKYHKESHDQWKIEVNKYEETLGEYSEQIVEIIPEEVKELVPTTEDTEEDSNQPAPEFAEEFTQTDEREEQPTITLKFKDKPLEIEQEKSATQEHIGTILEQKALFIFGGIALILFLLNGLGKMLLGGSKNKMSKAEKMQKGGGAYDFKRK